VWEVEGRRGGERRRREGREGKEGKEVEGCGGEERGCEFDVGMRRVVFEGLFSDGFGAQDVVLYARLLEGEIFCGAV